jgi:hypothetical protein
MKLSSLALTLALLPAALFAAGGNSGGTTATPSAPTVIPGGSYATTYVISAPGSYVLGGNRSANTAIYVIEIAAPDVTLDLNGFRLSNAPGASDAGGGVYVPTPENVEIRNGSIVDTGKYGILTKFGKGVRVIDVRVAGTTYMGINIQTAASRVERCQVVDCLPYGIWSNAYGIVISDCIVNGTGTGVGVSLQQYSQVVRTVARNYGVGFSLVASTAMDCSAAGGTIGFNLNDLSTLRGVESYKNTQGVFVSPTGGVVIGSRIMSNTTNFAGGGTYTNGGGNFIQ